MTEATDSPPGQDETGPGSAGPGSSSAADLAHGDPTARGRWRRLLQPDSPNGRIGRLRAVLIGILAAGLGMAVGHLVASFRKASASPVLAVGEAVIDRTPTELKDYAIRQFGTNDKLVLLLSVSAGALVLAGLAGLLARRIFLLGLLVELALVAVAGYAAMTRPAAVGSDIVPTFATAIVGSLTLFGLFWLSGDDTTRRVVERLRRRPSASSRPTPGSTRRVFLAGSGAVAGVAVGSAVVGQKLGATTATDKLSLPVPKVKAPAIPVGLESRYAGITPLRTPNGKFYRVDTSLTVPDIDRDSWRLHINGDVRNKLTLSYDDLTEMELIERNISLTCISNEPGGKYAGGATWLGVRTRDLLRMAGVEDADKPGRQVFSTSTEGFSISTPLGAMTDDRDALLAIGMNGKALPREHGFPARLVTPGLYGMLGCTKWVTTMKVTDYDGGKAYWTKRGWTTGGVIKPSARIDTPAGFSSVKRDRAVIGGIAWAQRRGVVRVQVKIDDAPWRDATIGPDVNVDYWRQWAFEWKEATAGQHTAQARVVYGDNDVQTQTRKGVFPDGSSGIVSVLFNVS